MALFHYYDIESLNNIFTLTNHIPEKNMVEQYFLVDPKSNLARQIYDPANSNKLLNELTNRVRLRNQNFNQDSDPLKPATGTVALYDLTKLESNLHLAKSFGLSDANNANNPLDYTDNYPINLRLTTDTDLPVKNGEKESARWQPQQVNQLYCNRINAQQQALSPAFQGNLQLSQALNTPNYHYYQEKQEPYLLGYNSNSYDLTMLAFYLQSVFNAHPANASSDVIAQADFYAQTANGILYYQFTPTTPQAMRHFNNYLFNNYHKYMPRILDMPPQEEQPFQKAYKQAARIRRNWLRSNRHIDVSLLNEKQRYVKLKFMLGQLGYQILESDKLKPGTAQIDTLDQFYELLAYNASDCINLKELFENDFYYSQFTLKKDEVHDYPMIVYNKSKTAYEPVIEPDQVRYDRCTINSTSAIISTNVVCPYGHLNDKIAVSFNYPSEQKAKEAGVKPFNVLQQTREYFTQNVYQPAVKTNKKVAKSALKSFNRVMSFYEFIENKNFNDSPNYFKKFIGDVNPNLELDYLKDNTWLPILNDLPLGELFYAKSPYCQQEVTYTQHAYIRNQRLAIPIKLYQVNCYSHDQQGQALTFYQVITTLLNHYYDFPASLQQAIGQFFNQLVPWLTPQNVNDYLQPVKQNGQYSPIYDYQHQQAVANTINVELPRFLCQVALPTDANQSAEGALELQEIRTALKPIIKEVFAQDWSLEVPITDFYLNYPGKLDLTMLTFYDRDSQKVTRPYVRPYQNKDLPNDCYSLFYYDKNGLPTDCYVNFSIGGIHGAQYNKKLIEQDIAHDQAQAKLDMSKYQTSLLDTAPKAEAPKVELDQNDLIFKRLFKPTTKDGIVTYKLNTRYQYVSAYPVNHEDFSSYYPSLCRQLNVYWNDLLGKDIYGEVYDRKEALGKLQHDPSIPKEKRIIYGNMRNGTKLILNSTTGKGDSHGQNSPIQLNNNIMAMRLIGQMFTWRIGQAQTLVGAKVVSTNTDGLYTVLADTKLNDQVLKQESAEIHVKIDPERLYLISKDTNNRAELDLEKHTYNIVSGADLSAALKIQPVSKLSHPAALDRALALYLQELTNKESKNYEPTLTQPYDHQLGQYYLTHLFGDPNQITDPQERLHAKQQMLNYYQVMISNKSDSSHFMFALKDLIPNINNYALLDSQKALTQEIQNEDDDVKQLQSDLISATNKQKQSLTTDDVFVLQDCNRIFYLKDTAPVPLYHIYVANGKTITPNSKKKRQNNPTEPKYYNSPIAQYVIRKNGQDPALLNQSGKDTQIVRQTNLQPQWHVYINNHSVWGMTEQQCDDILNNLDLDAYNDLFYHTFAKKWSNNVNEKKVEETYTNHKYAINL